MGSKVVPSNILRLWFWMIDSSGSVELEQSATESILKFYTDMNMARKELDMPTHF